MLIAAVCLLETWPAAPFLLAAVCHQQQLATSYLANLGRQDTLLAMHFTCACLYQMPMLFHARTGATHREMHVAHAMGSCLLCTQRSQAP